MNNKLKRQYIRILKGHVEEGLRVLEHKTNIIDEHFQRIVVNINNSSNIIVQLQADLTSESKKDNPVE